jgi:serine/threonine-protein kinase
MSGGTDVLARFAREAEAVSTVNHPNVVSILDIDVGQHGELFIVMERVAGSALDAHRRHFGDRAWALPLLGQLARALAAIHAAGVVHRDLKPGNILVDGAHVIKVADFGIAMVRRGDTPAHAAEDGSSTQLDRPARPWTARAAASELTQTGMIMGSPFYMAPETVRGAQVTSQADIFSFGIIAFEMLTGQRPFEQPIERMTPFRAPTSLRLLCGDLPGDLPELIDRSLALDPTKRPTAEALARALDGGSARR